jgi:branched-chain amino acid aminotransferase
MINTKGEVVESTRANLFWMLDGAIHTAPINSGALPGITRSKVIDLCNKEGSSVVETRIQPDDLLKAEGVFATVSTYGLVDIIGLDGQEIPKSPTTTRLSKLYQILLHSTGSL